jgi:N-acetylglucosaminyldiphosphoundecaprenol N-acetyl-beta-D-mannosaminyltransferase
MIIESFKILNVPISVTNSQKVFDQISKIYKRNFSQFICVRDVHGLILNSKNKELFEAHQKSALVVPDGKPIEWIGRILGYKNISQVCGRDLVRIVLSQGKKRNWRHYFYGGKPGVAEKMVENLRLEFPNVRIVGFSTPPFGDINDFEIDVLANELKNSRTDILWIGLSTPKQEIFMQKNKNILQIPLMFGVGAAFDFIAGTKKVCPIWMQRLGLEWAFRCLQEPRRLGPRYLRIIPIFIVRIIQEFIKMKVKTHRRKS